MAIKPKKTRESFLGSIEVTDFKPDAAIHTPQKDTSEDRQVVQVPEPVEQIQVQTKKDTVEMQTVQNPAQPVNVVPQPYAMQPMSVQGVNMNMYPRTKTPGRKRKILIPGDVDKTISVQLPALLVNRIQEFGKQHGMSMKEVIGTVLIERFMK